MPMMLLLLLLLPWLMLVNAASIAAFASDKRRAIRGEWRISERDLLALAVLGGSPGAMWARARFRHKTRKQPFTTHLDLIGMAHGGIAAGLLAASLLG